MCLYRSRRRDALNDHPILGTMANAEMLSSLSAGLSGGYVLRPLPTDATSFGSNGMIERDLTVLSSGKSVLLTGVEQS